jgi:hypothetical protein
MNKTTREKNAQGMLVFPVWVSRVKSVCTVCFLCHLLSRLNLYSSLLLGLAWKCFSFPNRVEGQDKKLEPWVQLRISLERYGWFLVLAFSRCCSEFFEGKSNDLVVQVKYVSAVKNDILEGDSLKWCKFEEVL